MTPELEELRRIEKDLKLVAAHLELTAERDALRAQLAQAQEALRFSRETLGRAVELIAEGADGAITDTIWAADGLTLLELVGHTFNAVDEALRNAGKGGGL